MASNYTENYGLCQWEATDQVLREEFNWDNKKLDSALKNLANQNTSLAATDALLEIALSKCGNCQIYTTTYTGQGGSLAKQSIEFPWLPLVVIIMGSDGYTMITTPEQEKIFINPSSVYNFPTIWSGNTLSWNIDQNGASRMNGLGILYRVVCLGVAE